MNETEAAHAAIDGAVMRCEAGASWDEARCVDGVWQRRTDMRPQWSVTDNPLRGRSNNWQPVHADGSREWAQEQARADIAVCHETWDNPWARTVGATLRFYGSPATDHDGIRSNSITSDAPKYAAGWSIWEPPEPQVEHVADVIGVKLLTAEGCSPFAQRQGGTVVHYPLNEWVEVGGEGAFVSLEDGLTSGAPPVAPYTSADLAVAYVEAHTLLGDVSHLPGTKRYRWVRRLAEPRPEAMSEKWHRFVENAAYQLTDEQLAALRVPEPEPEPTGRVVRLAVVRRDRTSTRLYPEVVTPDTKHRFVTELNPDHVVGYVYERPDGTERFTACLRACWYVTREDGTCYPAAVADAERRDYKDCTLARLTHVLWIKEGE